MANPRMLMAVLGVAALLIIVLLVSLIRGCTSRSNQTVSSLPAATVEAGSSSKSSSTTTKKKTDTTSSATTGSDADSSGDDVSDDSSTDSDDSANKTDSSTATASQKVVKISLAKGKTSWIEVKVDGVSQYADTPVGPYEAEYTPTKSIEITVDNPSDVQVTENGDKVRWDSKTSGVGRVTITVPQATTTSAATDETTSSDSEDSSSDSSTSN